MERTEYPLITVNILSWNSRGDMSFILNKIKQADYPPDKLEIIVVDNASIDGTPEMVEKYFPRVKLIRRTQNNGIGGWNDGFRVARGEYIIVLDHDAYPDVDAYYKIVEYFKSHPKCGILALGIVMGFESAGEPNYSWDDTIAVGFGGGTSVIRREVIEKVGYFDEYLFICAHEFDFAVRALSRDYEIHHTYDIKIFHKAAGVYRHDERYIYYTTRNKLWVTWKYFPLYAILISNFIWIIHSFLLSLAMKTSKGFWRSLKDALLGMTYLRKYYQRHHLVNPAVTKKLLRRFSLKTFIRGIKDISIIHAISYRKD